MSLYENLYVAESKGIDCAVCTIIDAIGTTPRAVGSKMIVYENGDQYGSVGGGSVEHEVKEMALTSIRTRKFFKKIVNIDKQSKDSNNSIEVFIEPISMRVNLIVFGSGHIGKQVAFFGKQLGWHIIIVDDRPELCNEKNIPCGDEFIIGFSGESIDHLDMINSYCILTTRNSEIDLIILKKILNENVKFIGVLGSQRRWEQTKKELIKHGFSETEINRIHSPIGIKINAETPEEIAISIISQIIMIRNQKN